MLIKRAGSLILLVVFVLSGTAATKARRIPKGSWGGDQINVTVDSNSATIEYSCARGTINGPLVLDSKGRFKLTGMHMQEHGGPIRNDEGSNAKPAVYTGTVSGKTMNLTVKLTGTNQTIGTFKLTQGQEGKVFRCM